MTTKIIFAADREDAHTMLEFFPKARVMEPSTVKECLEQAATGELDTLVVWQKALCTGWRGPRDTVVLFTPLFAYTADQAVQNQASARVTKL